MTDQREDLRKAATAAEDIADPTPGDGAGPSPRARPGRGSAPRARPPREIRRRRQWPLPKLADAGAPLLVVEDLRTHFKLGPAGSRRSTG